VRKIDLTKMPLGNGGGSVKTLDDVIKACKAPMTEIEVGSITMNERPGNTGETYYFHPQDFWSLNALGLPNLGSGYYFEHLPEMVERAHDAGKKLRANIAPFSPEECGQMAAMCLEAGADSVVINGSCPNVWDGGAHSVIPALHPRSANALFEGTKRHIGSFEHTWFKLSPTEDLTLVRELAAVFRSYGIRKLVCCNTKGGQRRQVDGKDVLAFRATGNDALLHEGGLAGTGVQKENLATACAFILNMPGAEVIGLGGIFNGFDASEYLDAGCVGVQMTTAYLEFGGQVFVDVLSYLSDKVPA
jgi:dihydroorotate dehydrogenase (fumarate)